MMHGAALFCAFVKLPVVSVQDGTHGMIKIESFTLDDLANDQCVLNVVEAWTVELTQQRVWLHDEKGNSIEFSNLNDEYWILHDARESLTVSSRVSAATGMRYKVSALANLWQLGVLRIYSADDINSTALPSSRFRWQDEYFRAFSNTKNTVAVMNENIVASSVCIIGLGGLGSMLASLLGAAGVGTIRLIDGDVVGEDNLPRQILFPESSVGRSKVDVLKEIMTAHNSTTKVIAVNEYISSLEQVCEQTKGADFIVLCADQPRLDIRAWIGKASIVNEVPFLAMGSNWVGPISVPYLSACYLCQARTYRSRYADAQSFVKKITLNPLPARAAFGPGPTIIAGFMASAVIHYLAGQGAEELLHKSFRVSRLGHVEHMTYTKYRDCAACARED